jgi:nitrate/nitrite-specific signal transduction histidine kinase
MYSGIYGKRAFLSIAVMAFMWSSAGAVTIGSPSEAVNLAGKERMFTQRMLKDYAMVGIGTSYSNPAEDLKKTISLFEDHLNALDAYNKDEEIKNSIAGCKSLWNEVKAVLGEKPDMKKAVKLQHDLEKLLAICDRTTKLFASKSGTKAGEIINISGRQRMLSQRMASLYMLKAWGIEDPEFDTRMKEAMDLFSSSLKKLMQSNLTTPEIASLLKKVEKDFMFFKIMNRSDQKFIPSLICKKSDEILQTMDKATGLYTKLEKK